MARIVKTAADRQDEILDVAQRLFVQRGYADTPVQAIIAEIGIAKGTFYHHYPSKPALLDAVVSRMVARTIAVIQPLVDDPAVGAIAKLCGVYRSINAWKFDQHDLMLDLQRALSAEANAPLVRRLERDAADALTPRLATIVAQGVREGVFDTRHPDQAGRFVLALAAPLSRVLGDALIAAGTPSIAGLEVELDAYHDAVERVLGAKAGTVRLIEREAVSAWFAAARRSL